MNLNDLLQSCGEWLRGVGPDSDIVVSSRARLARNLAGYPFITRASEEDQQRVLETVRGRLFDSQQPFGELLFVDLTQTEELDRFFLVERQLISREMAEAEGPRAVVIGPGEQFGIMINEEDHLRMQAVRSGFDVRPAWELINKVDDFIEEAIPYAFHDKYGYLTACPTNVGTGLRVSVLVHLPALALTRQIEKVFRSLHKISLAVRGLFGEGSQATGDFYQISNQVTLGRSEEELIQQVEEVVPNILDYERQARKFLLRENRREIHDRVSRAYGLLQSAQQISTEEAMSLLSSVRLGISIGLIENLTVQDVNRLCLFIQPAHLQKMTGVELDAADRDIQRARYLREQLARLASERGSSTLGS